MMKDTSVTKVSSEFSPRGPAGQKYLASGVHIAMRLWENEQPKDKKPASKHPYEVVGYVIKGKAELHLEGQTLILNAGDSYTVPKNAEHTYKILESFTAVEATSPPALAHQ
jgi:quercetin dioxygenase-like cupin family protein